jgi:ribonuclease BN (tRNA processing enzyme)
MKVRVLGCYGGEMPGYRTTCLMLNGNILIDAGAITSALSLVEQRKIDAIVLSHSHLDHIRDLGFLADNIFGQRDRPVRIYGLPETLRQLRSHVLNNLVWPDFSVLPTPEKSVISFHELHENEPVMIEGIEFTTVKVDHTVATAGFVIKNQNSTLVFSGDTGPTEALWAQVAKNGGASTVVLETSFPDRMTALAQASGHLTPMMAKQEQKKFDRPGQKVRIFHLKPQFLKEIIADLDPDNSGLCPLTQDELIEL